MHVYIYLKSKQHFAVKFATLLIEAKRVKWQKKSRKLNISDFAGLYHVMKVPTSPPQKNQQQ